MVDEETKRKIAAKIAALFNKTVQNGASEAEAMQATIKAHELLLKYQIELGSIELQAQEVIWRDTPKNTTANGIRLSNKNLRIKWWLCSGVAEYCDCKVWGPGTAPEQIRFMGLPSDVEFALWLIDSLAMFTVTQMERFMVNLKIPGHMAEERWQEKKAFILGCCSRITQKLQNAKGQEAEQPVMSDGRSLVLVKNQKVEEAWAKKNLKLKDGRASQLKSISAFAHGYAAGEGASIGRPIESKGSNKRIVA